MFSAEDYSRHLDGGRRGLDRARPLLVLAGAVGQAVLPAVLLSRFRFEKPPPEMIQPAGWAFSVWIPIYATCLGYALGQARPAAPDRALMRQVGWPLAGAFASNAAWAPLVVRHRYWAAQAALFGTAGLSGLVRRRLSRAESEGEQFSTAERRTLLPGAGMLAAWSAAASGVNLAAMLVGEGPVPSGRPGRLAGGVLLLALGTVGRATLRPETSRGRTSKAYAATLLWAFAGVVDGRRAASPATAVVAAVAATPVLTWVLRGALGAR